jgi:tRNA-binding protein
MDLISFDDFQKMDIRVGTVVAAEVPAWSHWVMKLTVDLGPEVGQKVCFSGIMKFFKPESFVGKQFPFIVNLEPKKIGPEHELSEVMMMMACPGGEDNEVAPVLFKVTKKVPNGCVVR